MSTRRITEVKTHVLRYEVEPERVVGYADGWVTERCALIVEIFTDDGIVGIGETCNDPPEASEEIIQRICKPILIGADPFNIELLWQTLYNKIAHDGRRAASVASISGIDIALWDIMGKAFKVPVHKLIGGCCRDKIPAYASHIYIKPKQNVAKEAEGFARNGFKAIKVKVGTGLRKDKERVDAIRGAVGDEIKIMIDANCSLTASSAIKLGRELEKYDIEWFEEPLPPDDTDGYLEVKRGIDIPIAAGESEFNRYRFKEIISRRAIDIVQPDVCIAAGISECKNIARMANAWNIKCIPHCWNAAVGVAASLHFIASIPEFPATLYPAPIFFEYETSPNPLRQKLVQENVMELENGFIRVPQEPGLGITINREILEKFSSRSR
jgi:D-galactarolactone cycloisomerase